MFKSKNTKKIYPCIPQLYYIKWCVMGVKFHGHVSMMILLSFHFLFMIMQQEYGRQRCNFTV